MAFLQKIKLGVEHILSGYIAPASIGMLLGLLIRLLYLKSQQQRQELEALISKRTQQLEEANQRLQHEIDASIMTGRQFTELQSGVETIFNTLPLGILYIDLDYRILRASKQLAQIAGISQDEMIGKFCYETMPSIGDTPIKRDRPCDNCALEKCAKDMVTITTEKHLGDKYFNVITAPEINADGKVYRFLKVTQDITTLKHQQNDLVAAKELAEAANQAKSASLANMSHEIRTPMNAIIGMTDLCIDSTDRREQQEYLNHIKDASESLLRILNDILDISKIESGKLTLEETEFNLPRAATAAIETYRYVADSKGLSLELVLAPDLPAKVMGDPYRLRQIINNLLSNALKFTENGGVKLTMSIDRQGSALKKGHIPILVSISDTGVGLPNGAQDTLFERFSQIDSSTTRRYGGTGLGLSICKKLVEIMDGRIWVDSSPEIGSTFSFSVQMRSTSDNNAPRTDQGKAWYSDIAPRNMLVVEDNEINRKLLKIALEKKGHKVTEAHNGKEAIVALHKTPFDMIFMDIHMPEMDGCETTHFIRNSNTINNPDIPIIAVTANALKGTREQCLKCGMDDYLAKPIRISDLYNTISQHIPSL